MAIRQFLGRLLQRAQLIRPSGLRLPSGVPFACEAAWQRLVRRRRAPPWLSLTFTDTETRSSYIEPRGADLGRWGRQSPGRAAAADGHRATGTALGGLAKGERAFKLIISS